MSMTMAILCTLDPKATETIYLIEQILMNQSFW
jgi:hypothetical protein